MKVHESIEHLFVTNVTLVNDDAGQRIPNIRSTLKGAESA